MNYQIAPYRTTTRIIGWWPPLLCGAALALAYLIAQTDWAAEVNLLLTPENIPGFIVPLFVAMHAAFLFSPDDEAALELALAAPRPVTWLLLERLVLLLAGYGAVALLFNMVMAATAEGTEPLATLISRWLSPTLFFSGLAVMLTLLTRQGVFSALTLLLAWGGLTLGGNNLVQMCAAYSPLHPFLAPNQAGLAATEYAYNRLVLLLLGGLFLLSAVSMAGDEERMMGVAGWRKTRPKQTAVSPDRWSYGWLAVGLALLYLAWDDGGLALLALLAPIFLCRFLLTQPNDPSLALLTVGVMAVAAFHTVWGNPFFNQMCAGLRLMQTTVLYAAPLLVARLILPHLRPTLYTTLVLPAAWGGITTVYWLVDPLNATVPALALMPLTDWSAGAAWLAGCGAAGLAAVINWFWGKPSSP